MEWGQIEQLNDDKEGDRGKDWLYATQARKQQPSNLLHQTQLFVDPGVIDSLTRGEG